MREVFLCFSSGALARYDRCFFLIEGKGGAGELANPRSFFFRRKARRKPRHARQRTDYG
jgi:hypothetical protein